MFRIIRRIKNHHTYDIDLHPKHSASITQQPSLSILPAGASCSRLHILVGAWEGIDVGTEEGIDEGTPVGCVDWDG